MGVLSEVGKLLTLREPLDLPPVLTAYPSRASGFTSGFMVGSVTLIFFVIVLCRFSTIVFVCGLSILAFALGFL